MTEKDGKAKLKAKLKRIMKFTPQCGWGLGCLESRVQALGAMASI